MATYDEVWKVDDRMAAPPLWTSESNPFWHPESMMERLGVAVSELRDGTWEKPNEPGTQWGLVNFIRWGYAHAADGKAAVNDQVIPKLDQANAKLDQLLAGQADAAAKLDQIGALLDQHSTGELDAAAVVDGIRALVHRATAPAA